MTVRTCVLVAALAALLGGSNAARAQSEPAPADVAATGSDAATATLAELARLQAERERVGEKDRSAEKRLRAEQEALVQKNLELFQLLPVGTEAGKAAWSRLALNQRQAGIDALRFRTPAGERRDLAWAFKLVDQDGKKPAGWSSWFLLPAKAGVTTTGFRNFVQPDEALHPGFFAQHLPGSALAPDAEFVICFVFARDPRQTATVVAGLLLPPGRLQPQKAALWAALGAPPPAESLPLLGGR